MNYWTKLSITDKEWKGVKPPKGRYWQTDSAILEQWDKQGLVEWSSNGVPRKQIFFYEKHGKKMQDIWEFNDPQYPQYFTEKSLDLLKLIVETSSNEGDLVFDCFTGAGTTLIAAPTLNRNWISIDNSKPAIKVAKKRLEELPNSLFSGVSYEFLKEL